MNLLFLESKLKSLSIFKNSIIEFLDTHMTGKKNQFNHNNKLWYPSSVAYDSTNNECTVLCLSTSVEWLFPDESCPELYDLMYPYNLLLELLSIQFSTIQHEIYSFFIGKQFIHETNKNKIYRVVSTFINGDKGIGLQLKFENDNVTTNTFIMFNESGWVML